MHVASGLHVFLRQACLTRTATGLQRNWCRPNRNGRFCSRTEEPGEQRFCHHQRLNSQWDCLFPNGPTLSSYRNARTIQPSTSQQFLLLQTQHFVPTKRLSSLRGSFLIPRWMGKLLLGRNLQQSKGEFSSNM